jgi:hypothetical protein
MSTYSIVVSVPISLTIKWDRLLDGFEDEAAFFAAFSKSYVSVSSREEVRWYIANIIARNGAFDTVSIKFGDYGTFQNERMVTCDYSGAGWWKVENVITLPKRGVEQ